MTAFATSAGRDSVLATRSGTGEAVPLQRRMYKFE
jgi:hypothetical protein